MSKIRVVICLAAMSYEIISAMIFCDFNPLWWSNFGHQWQNEFRKQLYALHPSAPIIWIISFILIGLIFKHLGHEGVMNLLNPEEARRKKGLCTKCAYDLRGTLPKSPCPECGTFREHQSSIG